jgi:hypothetical protein
MNGIAFRRSLRSGQSPPLSARDQHMLFRISYLPYSRQEQTMMVSASSSPIREQIDTASIVIRQILIGSHFD